MKIAILWSFLHISMFSFSNDTIVIVTNYDSTNIREQFQAIVSPDGDTIRCGYYHLLYENGNFDQKGYYANGKLTGLWILYHPNGVLDREISFDNDQQNGLSRVFHENGSPL